MGILNQLFPSGKNNAKEFNYLDETEQTAEIIMEAIEKGQLSKLSKKLGKLSKTNTSRKRFVFERPSSEILITRIVFCVFFAIDFLYFLTIGLATLMYSNQYAKYGLIEFIGAMTIIMLNIVILAVSVRTIQFYKRYDKYENILRYHNIMIIDDLARYSNINFKMVIRDLNKAVSKKFIPQGHFGRENLIFMTSYDMYNSYQEKPAVYDGYYRKMIEERVSLKYRTEKIQKIIDIGQFYIGNIHDVNNIIKDKNISQKLNRMEKAVTIIFHEIDVNPVQADKLGRFLGYYLLRTEKLLTVYIRIDEKQIQDKCLEKTRKDIESILDVIISSFEEILDILYQKQEMDMLSDISAMEIIMKQEGLKVTE